MLSCEDGWLKFLVVRMLLFLRISCAYRLSIQRFHPFVNDLFFIHQCKMWFMLSTSMFYGRGNLFEWTSHSMLWLIWRKFVYFFLFPLLTNPFLFQEKPTLYAIKQHVSLLWKKGSCIMYTYIFLCDWHAHVHTHIIYNCMYCLHQTELALTGTIKSGQRLILMCTGPAAATVDLSDQL